MNTIIKMGCVIGFVCAVATPVFAGEQKVMVMLGGKFCEAYLGDVEVALAKVSGVRAVDVKSMKGHAVVTIDGEKVKGDQLAAAVNKVKGDGWHCTGEVMK
ncbi:MAG: cation transporter [Nitrospirae bacterium]|nr:cation transporter [Nitrospirota bacterium]